MCVARWSIATLLFLLLQSQTTLASDEVWLLNGDKFTGDVRTMEGGVLTFKSSYIDGIRIPWTDVAAVKIEQPHRVTASGVGLIVASVAPSSPGRARLDPGGRPSVEVPLRDITAIVPQSLVVFTGRAETGVIVTTGNSDVNSLHLTGEFNARLPKQRYTTDIAVNRAQDHGLDTTRNITSTFRFNRFVTARTYVNANIIVTNDPFRDIDLRTAPGVGIGYQILEIGKTTLSFDLGIGYVDEKLISQPNRSYWAAKEAAKFEHFLLPRRLQFFHQHDGYFGVSHENNVFVRTQTGLRITVAGGLIMTGQLGLDYDRRPAPGRTNTDRTFATTLGYRF